MKEIRFRAWSCGKMFYDPCEEMGIDGHINDEFNEIGGREFMQYTGLTDLHGKEIYEGDILEVTSNTKRKKLLEVKWYSEHARFGGYCHRTKQHYRGLYAYNKIGIVVGNIYENANLLEKV